MRLGLFGSTAMELSFWGATAVSCFTVTAGATVKVPSRGLDSTFAGMIGPGAAGALVSALCSSMKAENRICSPAVPFTEATLPASVLMSYVCPHAAGTIAAATSVRHSFMLAFVMHFLPPVVLIIVPVRSRRDSHSFGEHGRGSTLAPWLGMSSR